MCFEAVSRLKVNLGKSDMVSVGQVSNFSGFASILDFQVSSLPISYLGLPLGATFKGSTIWGRALKKVEIRLTGWKGLYLLKVGKISLIFEYVV